jgi:hypothetical protein
LLWRLLLVCRQHTIETKTEGEGACWNEQAKEKQNTSKQRKIAERARKGRRDDRAKERGRSKQARKEGTAKPVTKKEGSKNQTRF